MTEKLTTKNYTSNNCKLTIPTREEFHRRFSGEINPEDFEMYPVSNIGERIADDFEFDEYCKECRKYGFMFDEDDCWLDF
jgi:hypothetical protein